MGGSNSNSDSDSSSAIIVSGKVMLASIVFLFFVVVFILYLHLYARRFSRRNSHRSRRFVFSPSNPTTDQPKQGLQLSILESLPITTFNNIITPASQLECAVCLSNFAQGEKLRILPTCNHGFHLDCIDMWFHSHSTCPLCRNHVSLHHSIPTNILPQLIQETAPAAGSTNTASLSSTTTESNNGMLVIDIPQAQAQAQAQAVLFGEEEENKSPMMTRFKSLKRLLSREKRGPSSPTIDIEKGDGSMSINIDTTQFLPVPIALVEDHALTPYPNLLLRHADRGTPLGFPDRKMPHKLVVAVDVDEVLGSFVSALNKFIADRYSFNHSVSEYHVYEFFKIWNCSRDEADIRVHEFFKTSYFKAGIHPIPGARTALHKLSRFCDLSIVTSRQNAIKDHTIEWIEKHYPGLFREIHFGNHFAMDGESRPKSDICRSLGAQVLVDDNPRYAMECAEAGIRVLLFDYENSYPWCKTDSSSLHPLVTKVHNWEEVEQKLVSWMVS
ncbi:hypothetical protein GIB67_013247 [Kingdonia uniflora]|uniref:RING-type E3 ubiquitin transferase n=1 Tax=Kingdonia uniflora TaxID=39325 RepID=A0A7J7NTG6_9MAGN|nr:hypothetical protein GIB67_013247 [Kingdonia uniflora]